MKIKTNFLVTGIVRDCEKTIEKTVAVLFKALSFANRIEFFFVESDSNDNTIQSLKRLEKKIPNFNWKSLGHLNNRLTSRTSRLAFCRNKYLEYLRIKENNWMEYMIVVDADGVCTELTQEMIKRILNIKSWSAITANVKGYYYDIYALRHPEWSPDDCLINYKHKINTLNFSQFESLRSAVLSKMIHIKPSKDLIKVESAFGGLAIYRTAAIPPEANYSGYTEANIEISEHVPFNKKINEYFADSIYIDPELIIGKSPSQHTKYAGLRGLIIFRFKCLLINLIKVIKTKLLNNS